MLAALRKMQIELRIHFPSHLDALLLPVALERMSIALSRWRWWWLRPEFRDQPQNILEHLPWNDEKKAIKEGHVPEDWQQNPAKLRHKDRDARWTVKFTKAKPRQDGTPPPVDIANSGIRNQRHVSIDRAHGFIRRWSSIQFYPPD